MISNARWAGGITITGHQGGAVPEYHEREVAREIDAAWFDGELAALAEHIGCAESPDLPAPDEERLARLGASEDRDTC